MYRGARTRAELNVLLDVLDVTLGDSSEAEYRELLDNLRDLWNEVQSVTTLPWSLDLLDLLTVQPCRDKRAREQLATAVLATCRAFGRRIEPSLLETINDVVIDLGLSEELAIPIPEAVGEANRLSRLKGLRVAVYTLSESAAIRVRNRLSEFTENPVTVRSDKVCTEALREADGCGSLHHGDEKRQTRRDRLHQAASAPQQAHGADRRKGLQFSSLRGPEISRSPRCRLSPVLGSSAPGSHA